MFFARHPPTLSQGEQKTHRYACFPPMVAGFRWSPAKKPHWGFFPWLPHRCLATAVARNSHARSRVGALRSPRVRPSLARASFRRLQARASQGSFLAPCLSLPLSSSPLLRLRSLGVGLRASAWLKSPSRVPCPLDPRSLGPAVPPCASPFPASAPLGGGFRALPCGSRRSFKAFPPPP